MFSGEIRDVVLQAQSGIKETQDSIRRLASHDMNQAIASQSRLQDAVRGLETVNEEMTQTLAHLKEDVDAAIQALQFEDIVTQILGGVDDRVTALTRGFIEVLNQLGHHFSPELTTQVLELLSSESGAGSVQQTSIEAGTVDLF